MRAILRLLLWIVAIVILLLGVTVWWFVYRPLPQLDGHLSVPGLHSSVTVERDNWGVPHIRAASLEDLAEAQGYVMAQDRLWQMDLLRRVARGQLSEILGPATIEIDKDFRTLNFSRAAEREVRAMDPVARNTMEAYSRGVNRFIDQHQNKLPIEFTLLKYKPQPWQVSDSIVIAGYMYRTLSDTRQEELDRAFVTAKVSPELARDLFSAEASLDHFVVGDPEIDRLTHDASQADADGEDDDDEMDYDDILKANRVPANPSKLRSSPSDTTSQAGNQPDLTSFLAASVNDWLRESQRDIRHSLGSNNWVVSGAHTATGKPLLANDTHLELTLPGIWYEVHLTAPGWNLKGFTLPGAPLVVLGHNDRIAWGFTNSGADVLDLYQETFNPASPDEYRVKGQWKKADVYDEIIHVKGARDEHLKLVVTRHGPVVHRDGDKVYSMRWTALEPGGLGHTYTWLGKAQNWNEFRDIIKDVWGPAQNVVYADVDGNIGFVMAARVPVRKKGHGEVPMPGDTDDYEWTGYIPFDKLPQSFNPDSGLIVTANGRTTGPDYKPYITDHWEDPYRTARIWDLLHDKHDLRPIDMLKVETDAYSFPHFFLAQQLAAAVSVAPPKDNRTKKLIEQAKDWNGIADTTSPSVAFLVNTQHQALQLILEPLLGAQTDRYNWRSMAFLQRVLSERPSRWLPSAYRNYDELLIAAADRAVVHLEQQTHKSDPADWTWRHFNYLEMLHPIGHDGALKKLLSISGRPQAGTIWSPRASSRTHGPSERFVANLADWDDSIMLITAGQSGQPGSEHYADQFSYWYEGKPIFGPFSDAAEAKTKKHTLVLNP